MKLEFSRQILKKYSDIKFEENLPNGSRDVPWGRTDGQTDGNAQTLLFTIWRTYLKTVHEDGAICHQGCVTLNA